MQVVVAFVVALALAVLLPVAISRLKRRYKRRRRTHAVGSAIDAGFALFDPAKTRALQVMEIRKEIGHADEGSQGDLLAPPAVYGTGPDQSPPV